jgi:hypothetical protein
MNEKITPTTGDQLRGPPPDMMLPPFWAIPAHFLQQQGRDPLKPEKVAIIGTQPSSRMVAPYNDPSWTIWGSSPGNQNQLPRVDAWFEMHCNFLWPQYRHYGEPYLAWLNSVPFPVVAQDQQLIKKAVTYPRDKMLRRFGPRFFTSTFAWMMAYAIDAGAKEMALYGVDMSSQGEYIKQRAGGHYFMQRAEELGINVIIPPESDLAQPPPLYGYSDATPFGRKMATREQEVKDRIAQIDAQLGPLQNQRVYLAGALEDIGYFRDVYGSIDEMYALRPDDSPPREGGADVMNAGTVRFVHPLGDVSILSQQHGSSGAGIFSSADQANGDRAAAYSGWRGGTEPFPSGLQQRWPESGSSGFPANYFSPRHSDLPGSS